MQNLITAALGVKRADLAQVVGVGARRRSYHSSRLNLAAWKRLHLRRRIEHSRFLIIQRPAKRFAVRIERPLAISSVDARRFQSDTAVRRKLGLRHAQVASACLLQIPYTWKSEIARIDRESSELYREGGQRGRRGGAERVQPHGSPTRSRRCRSTQNSSSSASPTSLRSLSTTAKCSSPRPPPPSSRLRSAPSRRSPSRARATTPASTCSACPSSTGTRVRRPRLRSAARTSRRRGTSSRRAPTSSCRTTRIRPAPAGGAPRTTRSPSRPRSSRGCSSRSRARASTS